MDDTASTSKDESTPDSNEIQDYLVNENFIKNENLLTFWKINESKYQIMSQLARRVLGFPATSDRIEGVSVMVET